MGSEMKKRVVTVVEICKTAFHWGFIPAVIYLGLKRGPEPGMPPLSIASGATTDNMQVGTASRGPNPNTTYFNSKGMWITYVIVVAIIHYVFLSLPFLSVAMAWTLTNVIHNALMFVVLHLEKGTPFETADQGKARYLTVWEQFDHGEHFSASKKFLTVVPVVLFFLASFYTKYDSYHFGVNAVSLLSVVLPKLPIFHGVRLFGINKY